jgi:hypothetical protein
LGDQSVQVGEAGRHHTEVLLANVVDRLVVHLDRNINVDTTV